MAYSPIKSFIKYGLLFVPILSSGQDKTVSKNSYNINDLSNGRFNIDSNGFKGPCKTDTTYYNDGKIAVIGHYAVDKDGVMSGVKFGLWTSYYHNGQVSSQGNYDMYSLLYYHLPNKGRRRERPYKVGQWVYYYENGQVKSTGVYQTVIAKANTGIDTQYYKTHQTTGEWRFFNRNGSKSKNKDKIILEMEYNPNCD